MPNLLTEVKAKYNILSPTQKVVADYILNNSAKTILLPIGELADTCRTSETTVLRFLKKLGYSSYQLFKVKLAQEISGKYPQVVYGDIQSEDTIASIKHKVITSSINSIEDINNLIEDSDLVKCIDILLQADKIIFLGIGGSSAVAQDAFHKFLRLGLNAIHVKDMDMMNLYSAHTTSKDVMFLVSHSGENREIINCAELAKENDAKIVALTSYKTSKLTKLADVSLLSSTHETKYHTDSMASRIIQLIIIDIIYMGLVLKSGENGIEMINKSRISVAKNKL